jgi:GT2 family glycosyltransferase
MSDLLSSVVIPTRNRPQAIENCLDALAAQTLPPGSFEVLVVDDGSEPALALDPARWTSKFELKLIRQNNTGPGGARNRGVAEARGEFLAFTDDDCLPTPTWLEKLVAALRANPQAMIGGSTFNGLKNDLFAETSQLILEMVYEHFNRDPANAYFFASNNMAMRRDNFLEIGSFDPSFRVASEDREFCDRWRMRGRSLVWERDALIEHRHAQTLADFCRLHFRYGRGAFYYQAKRKARKSGGMTRDLGFHRELPRLVRSHLSSSASGSVPRVLANLFLWQCVNAAGFFWAGGCRLFSRG